MLHLDLNPPLFRKRKQLSNILFLFQRWYMGQSYLASLYINAVICSEIKPIMKVMTLPV